MKKKQCQGKWVPRTPTLLSLLSAFLCSSVVKTKYVVTAQHHTASKQNENTRRRGTVSGRENKLKPQFSKCDKSSALMKYTTWNIPTIKNRCFSFLSCYCDKIHRAKHHKGWADLFSWQFQVKVHHCQEVKATDTWNIRSYYIHLRAENNELLHPFFCSDHFFFPGLSSRNGASNIQDEPFCIN